MKKLACAVLALGLSAPVFATFRHPSKAEKRGAAVGIAAGLLFAPKVRAGAKKAGKVSGKVALKPVKAAGKAVKWAVK